MVMLGLIEFLKIKKDILISNIFADYFLCFFIIYLLFVMYNVKNLYYPDNYRINVKLMEFILDFEHVALA